MAVTSQNAPPYKICLWLPVSPCFLEMQVVVWPQIYGCIFPNLSRCSIGCKSPKGALGPLFVGILGIWNKYVYPSSCIPNYLSAKTVVRLGNSSMSSSRNAVILLRRSYFWRWIFSQYKLPFTITYPLEASRSWKVAYALLIYGAMLVI